jgi:uncharacterized protein (TIGR02145 family)
MNMKISRVKNQLLSKSAYLLILLFIRTSAFTQAPNKMSYQAVIRNPSGALMQNSTIGMRIQILQTSEFGAAVYVETHTPTTNVNGLVTIEIGSGSVVLGTFSSINWAAGPYFIKTETDITGGTNYSITGVSQILSVPYALHAKTVANYNETDPVFNVSAAKGITSSNILNWNTAFGWGNHSGLYKPVGYIPSWSEITSKPNTIAGFGITDAVTTSGNQSIAGNKTFSGTTTVASPINSSDAATKAYVDSIMQENFNDILIIINGFFDSRDGNQYNAVKIGDKIWMSENLNYYTKTGSWFYNNDSITYSNVYGRLYNWETALNVCPEGWHLPSKTELYALQTLLGGYYLAGGKLKEEGTIHWYSPNEGATNESGFTALPGGMRNADGTFSGIRSYAHFWGSTEYSSTWAYDLHLAYSSAWCMVRNTQDKTLAKSVRCIKD